MDETRLEEAGWANRLGGGRLDETDFEETGETKKASRRQAGRSRLQRDRLDAAGLEETGWRRQASRKQAGRADFHEAGWATQASRR